MTDPLNRTREELLAELMWTKSKLYRIERIIQEFRQTEDPLLKNVAIDLEQITKGGKSERT